jgi:hypothetical protein
MWRGSHDRCNALGRPCSSWSQGGGPRVAGGSSGNDRSDRAASEHRVAKTGQVVLLMAAAVGTSDIAMLVGVNERTVRKGTKGRVELLDVVATCSPHGRGHIVCDKLFAHNTDDVQDWFDEHPRFARTATTTPPTPTTHDPRSTPDPHAHAPDGEAPGAFAHDKLDAYRIACELAALANKIAAQIPRGPRNIADPLLRAASTPVLLLAEGGLSGSDRRQYNPTRGGWARELGWRRWGSVGEQLRHENPTRTCGGRN